MHATMAMTTIITATKNAGFFSKSVSGRNAIIRSLLYLIPVCPTVANNVIGYVPFAISFVGESLSAIVFDCPGFRLTVAGLMLAHDAPSTDKLYWVALSPVFSMVSSAVLSS